MMLTFGDKVDVAGASPPSTFAACFGSFRCSGLLFFSIFC